MPLLRWRSVQIDLAAVPGGGRNQKQVAGFRSRDEAEAALSEALAAYGGGDRMLSRACADAVDRGVLADNPVRRTQAPRAAPAGTVGWTSDEVERFLAASAGHRLGSAFHLAVVAGLRRGELLGLRWSDLDLHAGRLKVAQQLMVEGGRARLKPVPDRARRTVALPPSLRQMLVEHRKGQDAEPAGDATWVDDDLVFRAPGGGWLTPERFTRVMDELIKESRVRRITPNGLRRAGSLLAHHAPEAEPP